MANHAAPLSSSALAVSTSVGCFGGFLSPPFVLGITGGVEGSRVRRRLVLQAGRGAHGAPAHACLHESVNCLGQETWVRCSWGRQVGKGAQGDMEKRSLLEESEGDRFLGRYVGERLLGQARGGDGPGGRLGERFLGRHRE